MNIFIILILLIVLPLVLFMAWLILSSCLGDNVRASIAGASFNPRQAGASLDPRRGAYGRSYARGMGFDMGLAGSEQIEMENVMTKTWDEHDDEDDYDG